MVDKTQISIGFLIITILLGSGAGIYYTQFGDDIKFRMDEDKNTIYQLIDSRWLVSGKEYNTLFSGTTKLNRDLSSIYVDKIIRNDTGLYMYHNGLLTNDSKLIEPYLRLGPNSTIDKRYTKYKRGPIIIDTVLYDGMIDDIKKIPLSHKIEIINGSGLLYRYEARQIPYSEEYSGNIKSPLPLDRDMTIEWDEGYNWAKVYKSGIFKVQYKLKSDYESYYIRMFDPPHYEIINDTIYWNDTDFYMNVTPHTITDYGCVEGYLEDVNLNSGHKFVIGFGDTNTTLLSVSFLENSTNSTNNSMYWVDYDIDYYVNHTFDYMNTWAVIEHLHEFKNQTYQFKICMDIEGEGKYDIGVYNLSLNLIEAIDNNLFNYLDPWWNESKSFNNINCTDNSWIGLDNGNSTTGYDTNGDLRPSILYEDSLTSYWGFENNLLDEKCRDDLTNHGISFETSPALGLWASCTPSQSDYADIGTIDNDLKTINWWFRPKVAITSSTSTTSLFSDNSATKGIFFGPFTGLVANEVMLFTEEGNANFYYMTQSIPTTLYYYTLKWNSGTSNYDLYRNDTLWLSMTKKGSPGIINDLAVQQFCRYSTNYLN